MDNRNFEDLTDGEITIVAAQVNMRMIKCAMTGGEVTFSQTDIKALMKLASLRMLESKPTLHPDNFPDTIGGDETKSLPDGEPKEFDYVLIDEDDAYRSRMAGYTPVKIEREFMFVTGEPKSKNVNDAMRDIAEQMNEILKDTDVQIQWLGSIQYIGANPSLPLMIQRVTTTPPPPPDSDK